MALARTDTRYLLDMLEEMFGEGPLMDPEELATEEVNKVRGGPKRGGKGC